MEDLEKFLEAESQSVKIMNKCNECEKIRCAKCKYDSSQLSIKEAAELEEILNNIEIVKNPDENDKFMFLVQYVFGETDLHKEFPRHRSNYQQVLKSSLALRKKLEKLGKLEEFNEQIKLELERDYMKIINENEEIELAAFPECYNRLNVTYKKDSKTTPARMVNDHSTLHHPGMSCNIAQVKGKTSLNLCHNVLFHFFLHAVP